MRLFAAGQVDREEPMPSPFDLARPAGEEIRDGVCGTDVGQPVPESNFVLES